MAAVVDGNLKKPIIQKKSSLLNNLQPELTPINESKSGEAGLRGSMGLSHRKYGNKTSLNDLNASLMEYNESDFLEFNKGEIAPFDQFQNKLP